MRVSHIKNMLNRLKECGFECEAGPLSLCVDFKQLELLVADTEYPHRFIIGQSVWSVPEKRVLSVYAVRACSSDTKYLEEYLLSDDLPRPYHYGDAISGWTRDVLPVDEGIKKRKEELQKELEALAIKEV